ncbi:hypothetical protein AS156_30565 [Bradyrhizobium macuxiense]|uniref:Uncharacterized protein n=1 Tax=Bradyrhizobium macuxiense TaxID=1755647 RepID=A0A109K2N5_9BRAD|nr:hypothetical protein [Bradyrhizobium macuxiense]KWV59726.1 hypothetical protein AS156_30565 [Bradyrhizobium macuxiense]
MTSYIFEALPLVQRDDRHIVADYDSLVTAFTFNEAMAAAHAIADEDAGVGVVGVNVYRCPYDHTLSLHLPGQPERLAYVGKDLVWSPFYKSWIVDTDRSERRK